MFTTAATSRLPASAVGGYSALRTAGNGLDFFTGLPEHQPYNLSIAPQMRADPSWTVAVDGVRVVPRAGRTMHLELPVFVNGLDFVLRDERPWKSGWTARRGNYRCTQGISTVFRCLSRDASRLPQT